jgi:hypothetical protein
MLHQENSEAFVRRRSELLACGSMRGADNGRANFLPEKCQIAGNDCAAFICLHKSTKGMPLILT